RPSQLSVTQGSPDDRNRRAHLPKLGDIPSFSPSGMPETMTGHAIDDDPGQRPTVDSLIHDEEATLFRCTAVSDRMRGQKMVAQLQGEVAHTARISILGELVASIAHEV